MLQGICVRVWSSNRNVPQEREAQGAGARMWRRGGGSWQNWVVHCRHGLQRRPSVLSWRWTRRKGPLTVCKMAGIRISWSPVAAQYSKLASSARIWCSLKIWPVKGRSLCGKPDGCVSLYLRDHLLFVLLLQSLQNHYHPDVAKAAAVLNQSLSEIEDDISGLLELSAYEVALLCLCELSEPEDRRLVMGHCSSVSLAAGEGARLTFGFPEPGKIGKCLLNNGVWGSGGDRDGFLYKRFIAGSFKRLEWAAVSARVKSLCWVLPISSIFSFVAFW